MSMKEHCRMIQDYNLDQAYEEESWSQASQAHMIKMATTRKSREIDMIARNSDRLGDWNRKRIALRYNHHAVKLLFPSLLS
jgi:hypothetical protein